MTVVQKYVLLKESNFDPDGRISEKKILCGKFAGGEHCPSDYSFQLYRWTAVVSAVEQDILNRFSLSLSIFLSISYFPIPLPNLLTMFFFIMLFCALKGTESRDRIQIFWQKWIVLGPNKRAFTCLWALKLSLWWAISFCHFPTG